MTHPVTGFSAHNHAACITDVMTRAEDYCAEHKLRLTPARRRTLELLLADHRALGAYELLEKLKSEGLGSAPPIAYRALEFLVGIGFAHKVEALNAYIACGHHGAGHRPTILICRSCKIVAEADAPNRDSHLDTLAASLGFQIERAVVEAEGLCAECQKDAA